MKPSTALALTALVSAAAAAPAQDGAAAALERYGGLDLQRQGAVIDAQLALKLLRRGDTYSRLGRHREAIEEYRKAISADPTLAEAVRNLANTYYHLERYEEAKPLLARFIELQPTPTAGLIAAVRALGQLERDGGDFDAAIEHDIRAIELEPGNDSRLHVMANTYNNNGAPELAIRVYRAGLRAMPDNAFLDRSLGRILEQEGRLEEALAAYESAAAKDPDSPFYADLAERIRRRLAREG